MTAATTDIDFFMGGNEDDAPATTPQQEASPPDGDAVPAPAKAGTAVADIAAFLGSGVTEPEPETKAAPKKAAAEPEPERRPASSRQPVIHSNEALSAASFVGLTPDEAMAFPTERALWGEVNLRYREMNPGRSERDGETADPNDLPELKIEINEEEVAPEVAKALKQVQTYATAVKARADKRDAELRAELMGVKSEQSKAANSEALKAEVAIARMFDEKVTEWGDEFTELLGVPTRSFRGEGTEAQRTEATKLRDHVEVLLLGMRAKGLITGPADAIEAMPEVLEQAKAALWRDSAKRQARGEIQKGLKAAKGSAGMRPASTKRTEPAEQGDDAAKRSVSGYLSELGGDLWGGRKKVTA